MLVLDTHTKNLYCLLERVYESKIFNIFGWESNPQSAEFTVASLCPCTTMDAIYVYFIVVIYLKAIIIIYFATKSKGDGDYILHERDL